MVFSKSSSSEASNGKTASPTSKVSRVAKLTAWTRSSTPKPDDGSPSAQKSSSHMPKLSALVSKPRSLVVRKNASSKQSTKTNEAPEPPQASQDLEQQEKLDTVEDDLMKAREMLASVEQEKIQIAEELNEAKRSAIEANEKLQEAISSRENAVKEREEAQQRELEIIQKQHAFDISALHSATEEVHKFKLVLSHATDGNDAALSNAGGANRSFELNGENVDFLSGGVSNLESITDSDLGDINQEAAEMINKLRVELNALKFEFERAKLAEEKLTKMDELLEQLQTEATDARKSSSDACKQVGELKEVVASLEAKLMEANQSEKSAKESLEITMKKMDEYSSSLQDAETEIAALKCKIESLEIEVATYKSDIKELDTEIDPSQPEAENSQETVELLKRKIGKLEVEKLQTVVKNKVAASEVERLLEEKQQLADELQVSKDEEQNAKKAMEGLASILDGMSAEVRENQKKLLAKQAEIEDSKAQRKQLYSDLKNTEEKYEVMLNEAKSEIECLKKTVENFETKTSNSSTECDTKDAQLVDTAKRSEDEGEVAILKAKMAEVVGSLKAAEQEAQEAEADRNDMLNKLKQSQSAEASSFEVAEETKAEMLELKQRLEDRENNLQSITRENGDLRTRETAYLQKIEQISASLEEVKTKKIDEMVEPSKSEREHDPVPDISHEMSMDENVLRYHTGDQQPNESEKGIKNDAVEDPTGIISRSLSSEKYQKDDSGDDTELKTHGGRFQKTDCMSESTDQEAISTMGNPRNKKKPLLHKFGILLKRGNHKGPK